MVSMCRPAEKNRSHIARPIQPTNTRCRRYLRSASFSSFVAGLCTALGETTDGCSGITPPPVLEGAFTNRYVRTVDPAAGSVGGQKSCTIESTLENVRHRRTASQNRESKEAAASHPPTEIKLLRVGDIKRRNLDLG